MQPINHVTELIAAVEKAVGHPILDQERKRFLPDLTEIVNITGTPFESLCSGKETEVNYGKDSTPYVSSAWGPWTRDTPWGKLPELCLLIRKDIAEKIGFVPNQSSGPSSPAWEKKAGVFGPDYWKNWKPAPGFQDFRE